MELRLVEPGRLGRGDHGRGLPADSQAGRPCSICDTIYFGGGTPTLVPPDTTALLLNHIRQLVDLADDAEVTIEGNPESITREALAALRAAGFNRLSVGAQSFDDSVLTALGRIHDAARARDAVADARAAGWDNIALDLIFGAPGQTAGQWIATLEQAVALRPQHVSAYCLTIEPGTEFHRRLVAGEITAAGEEMELEMYAAACAALRAAGYERYEISNFALPGRRCRHNQKYWQGGDYVGLGAGAHSRRAGMRWANESEPHRYVDLLARGKAPVGYAERLSARRRLEEELMLGLRTEQGACLTHLGARHGRDVVGEYRSRIQHLVRAGLATADGSRVVLTERGIAVANEVALRLMS
jgi:oxygen-independent coproporphyrinogen-3 oxidase